MVSFFVSHRFSVELIIIFNLRSTMHDAGFEILAFPCNQFGGQEPGSNEEIVEFACTRFKAEYPIFDKVISNQTIEFHCIGHVICHCYT